MWSLSLVLGAFLLAHGNTASKDYKTFEEYLDYYEYDLDTDSDEELLAEIDDKIEAKEENYDRYRRQILVERLGLDRDTEVPDLQPTKDGHCPEECYCQVSKVRCTAKFLTEIPRGIPQSVEQLNLAFNKIVEIPARSLDSFRNTLGFLFLHSNEIRSLGNGLFSKMRQITVLRLSWNKLSGIRKTSLHGLNKLERLYLDNNRLTFIHPLAFRGLTNLVFLQLDGNKLSRLHHNVFVTLEFQKYFRHSSIEYLFLAKNEFRNFPRHIFDAMTALRLVHLHGNKWECTCEMKWLKHWIAREGKYKCKRNSLNPTSREECAVCAWPRGGERLQDIPLENFKCQPPTFTPEESSNLISEYDPSLVEKQNEWTLFHSSGFYSTQMYLRLDSYRRSMVHASCNLTMIPKAHVDSRGRDARTFAKSYRASFEGNFLCLPEYPADSEELWEVLRPYIGREMNLARRISRRNAGDLAESYLISASRLDERPVIPLTRGSISSDSKFLLSDSLSITISSRSRGMNESDGFNIHLRTSFEYTPDLETLKYSKHPWLLIRQPEPSTVQVALALERKTAAYRCKSVGQPKPEISWILPSGETLRGGESNGRYFVGQSGRLVIRKAVEEDSGYFQCLATIPETGNTTGFSPAAAAEISTLKIDIFSRVQGSSTFYNSRALRMENVGRGENWSSFCNVQSLPNATTGWIIPREQLLVGNSQSGQTSTDGSGTITVANFSDSDEGMYRCVASNPSGRAEYSVFVSIPSNDHELMETIEEPEMEDSDFSISTMVFPPNVDDVLPEIDDRDDDSHTKESELEVAEPKVEPSSNISIASLNSTVSRKNYSNPDEDDASSSKYYDFLSTPASFEKHTVKVFGKSRTHRPGASSPSPTLPARTGKTAKKRKHENVDPPSPKSPPLIPSHPRGPPAAGDSRRFAAAYVNRNVITSTFSHQVSHSTTSDVTPTSSSTTSQPTSTNRPRQRTDSRRRTVIQRRPRTRTRSGTYGAARWPSYVPSRQNRRFRTVPAGRIREGNGVIVPAGRISEGEGMVVPAKRVQEPTAVQLRNRMIRARAGDRIRLPCAEEVLRNMHPSSWKFRWTLPHGEVYERPGMFSSPDFSKFVVLNGSLVFPSLTTRDSGQYSCVAARRTGYEEYRSSVTLFVRSNRVEISDRALRAIRLHVGDSIAVDCSATGYPKPRVFWKTPKGTIIPQMSTRGRNEVFRNGTLYIHMIGVDDRGAYMCMATNGRETRTKTLVIRVSGQSTVRPTIPLDESPRNARPTPNQVSTTTTRISVKSESSEASSVDDVTQPTSIRTAVVSRQSITSSETLTSSPYSTTTSHRTTTSRALSTTLATEPPTDLSGDEEEEEEVYVEDEVLILEEIISDMDETTTEVPAPPNLTDSMIFVQEESFTGYGVEDGKINLQCVGENVDVSSDEWSFVWTMPSGKEYQRPGSYVSRDWSKFVHKNGSLSLHYLKSHDAGSYTCVATDESHGTEHRREATLIIRPNRHRPQISNLEREDISVRAGDSPLMPCDATGYPTPTITWITPWREKLVTGTINGRVTVYRNGSLQISEAQSRDQGSYTCAATNRDGKAERTVVLKVSTRPPRFLDSPRATVLGRVGERVLLSCAATGRPPPRQYWLLPTGGRISANQAFYSSTRRISPSASRRSWREAKFRVTSDGTLIISRATVRDIGRYHCVISNNIGRAASTVNLLVSD